MNIKEIGSETLENILERKQSSLEFLQLEYLSDAKWVGLNWQLGRIPVRTWRKMAVGTTKKMAVGKPKKMAVSTLEKMCTLEKMSTGTLEKMVIQCFPVVDLHVLPSPPKSAPSVGQSTTVPGKHNTKR